MCAINTKCFKTGIIDASSCGMQSLTSLFSDCVSPPKPLHIIYACCELYLVEDASNANVERNEQHIMMQKRCDHNDNASNLSIANSLKIIKN